MIDSLSDATLSALVGCFGGILLGLAARLGRFCTLGSIEDLLYGGSSVRFRMWGLAIGVAIIGSFGLVGLGMLDPSTTIYHRASWSPVLSISGGLIFGYGMALAGNCGFGALARLGGGDLRSFVIVLVLGVSAYVTLFGPLAHLRLMAFDATKVAGGSEGGISSIISDLSGVSQVVVGSVIGLVICTVSIWSRHFWRSANAIFWAVAVGVAVVSGWVGTFWLSQHGFDGTPVVSHTFAAPIGNTLLYLMTSSGRSLSFGVGSVAGVLAGAFIGSLIKGHFRWEACEDPRELKRQILGAALMGMGAVLALGCTIGQGISAFSVLSVSAPVVFLAIVAGAALGLRQLITGFSMAE